MAFDSILCDALFEHYSKETLQQSLDTLLAAILEPERITGEQLDGVSFQFAPKSDKDVRDRIEVVKAAIARKDGATEVETTPPISTYMNFSRREIE